MRSKFLDLAHVLIGKPVPTFPGHALVVALLRDAGTERHRRRHASGLGRMGLQEIGISATRAFAERGGATNPSAADRSSFSTPSSNRDSPGRATRASRRTRWD